MREQKGGHWMIGITMVIGAVLSIISVPEPLAYLRPAWFLLVAIFWMVSLPNSCGLFFAWVNGILLDVLYGTVFGQHAMAMVFVALTVSQFGKRLRMQNWWHQSIIVFAIVGLYQLIILWISSATGRLIPNFVYLLPALSSAIVWPLLVAFLQTVRRRIVVI